MKEDKNSERINEHGQHLDNDLMLLLIRRVIQDRPLGEIDVEQFRNFFFTGVWNIWRSEKEMQAIIKRFNQAIPNFLNGVSKVLEELGESHKRALKTMEKERVFRASLPEGVSDQDHPAVIELARKLTDHYYTLSAAEKLVRTSRQTLQTHGKNYQYGLRLHYPSGRSPKLLREDLIKYYRERFFKDYDFLTALIEGTE
jgi:hypothetical protein